ncbi:Translation factor guf1 mitochondrial, partial [Homalodisca vitripennis]
MISAKIGTGVDSVLEALVTRVPPPSGSRTAPLRALVFDREAFYLRLKGLLHTSEVYIETNQFTVSAVIKIAKNNRSAVALVYIHDGVVQPGDEVSSHHSKRHYIVKSVGVLKPHEQTTSRLVGGQVGYVVCNMRSVSEAHIGDTLHAKGCKVEPLGGISPAQPMVYAGVYPMDQSQHVSMRSAIEKLALNDPAVTVTIDSSPALGQGWRVGFLGLLHLEVFNQRLEQEYGAEAVMTAPSVPYRVRITGKKDISLYGGEEIVVSDPSKLPDPTIITEVLEPMVMGTIITPEKYMFKIVSECMERRGVQTNSVNIDGSRVMLQFVLPLNEIIIDFHDNIKSLTSGFASFDYEDHGYATSALVK